MPKIAIEQSPFLAEQSPVEIYYREHGDGPPMIHLHGGWGYAVYPFDRQMESFGSHYRILIPDRTGYGRSMRLQSLPMDFHSRAFVEMMNFLNSMKIDRCVLWGHSDGAVIAAMMGLAATERFAALILEAFHFYRNKPRSRQFFEMMAHHPEDLGERNINRLIEDHGEDYWRDLIKMNGNAWLDLADKSRHPKEDLFDGKLKDLKIPALFLHGSLDPRTEPDELQQVAEQLPHARIALIQNGGHCPHSERRSYAEANRIALEFLDQKL